MDVKRVFDIVGAGLGLAVFAPVMAVATLAILVDDGGPVLFRQERLGYRRRPFIILKFRTMRDGRVTKIGRVLRASGLDEIPQLLNILRGDMSAVGPRPLTLADVQRLGWAGADCDRRWTIRPGLTGLAQLVDAGSSRSSLALDYAYAIRWRPLLDCQIIALSFAVNVLGKSRVSKWFRKILQERAGTSRAGAV